VTHQMQSQSFFKQSERTAQHTERTSDEVRTLHVIGSNPLTHLATSWSVHRGAWEGDYDGFYRI
jgi:hypothetical protein